MSWCNLSLGKPRGSGKKRDCPLGSLVKKRTPSTLNAPTHYTRSSPRVLETPQYDICYGSNRMHARFLPNWLPTPSKILPKSSCLASRGTFPWSAFVDSDILGMLSAPLPLNHSNLTSKHSNFTSKNPRALQTEVHSLGVHSLTRISSGC